MNDRPSKPRGLCLGSISDHADNSSTGHSSTSDQADNHPVGRNSISDHADYLLIGRGHAANPSTGHIRSLDHSEHPLPVSRYRCVTYSAVKETTKALFVESREVRSTQRDGLIYLQVLLSRC